MKALLHFLVLGGLLFGAERLTADWPLRASAQTIHIRADQLVALQEEWRRALGRAPDSAQLQAGIRKLADDDMLLKEAMRLGLNRSDPVVRGRLLKNLRFAYPESRLSDEALLRQALALGMDQRDAVVRRRLVQLMEQRLASGAEVDDDALRQFMALHPERYGGELRWSFQQVFLSADRHRGDLAAASRRLQAALQSGATAVAGDPFLGGDQFESMSADEIARLFGSAYAQAVAAATPGQWIGPVVTVYGQHYLRVEQVLPAADADLEALRQGATYAVLEQQEQRRVQQSLIELRRRYPVVIDPQPVTLGALR